ncbi:MAG TPA: hypothetical protein VGG28_24995 [Kofleriaceae bacterium]
MLRLKMSAEERAAELMWFATSAPDHRTRLAALAMIIDRCDGPVARHLTATVTTHEQPMFDISKLPPAKQDELLALIRQLRNATEEAADPALALPLKP